MGSCFKADKISSVVVDFTFAPGGFSAWIGCTESSPKESFFLQESDFVALGDLEDTFEALGGGVTKLAFFKAFGSGDFPLGADLRSNLCVGIDIGPRFAKPPLFLPHRANNNIGMHIFI